MSSAKESLTCPIRDLPGAKMNCSPECGPRQHRGTVRFQNERRGPGVLLPLLLNRVLRGSKVRLGIWCERRRDLAERPETRTETHAGECVA
jgi:hypothetical protein